jgi:hypothetical protein
MADWPRRDRMKREGRTVYAKEDEWGGGWTRFDVGHAGGQANAAGAVDASMWAGDQMDVDWAE